jgi:8-oxo-dGTP diphosphatase
VSDAQSMTALHVVAGVLRNRDGQVLIAQRPPGKHMAGYWEFPGGKVTPDESNEQALARELAEELGITLLGCRSLLQLRHDYGDRIVELDVLLVDQYAGEPLGLEQQVIKWVATAELGEQGLLAADRPIIEALNSTR